MISNLTVRKFLDVNYARYVFRKRPFVSLVTGARFSLLQLVKPC